MGRLSSPVKPPRCVLAGGRGWQGASPGRRGASPGSQSPDAIKGEKGKPPRTEMKAGRCVRWLQSIGR